MSRIIPSTHKTDELLKAVSKTRQRVEQLRRASVAAYEDHNDKAGEQRSNRLAGEAIAQINLIEEWASEWYEIARMLELRGRSTHPDETIDEIIEALQKLKSDKSAKAGIVAYQ